MWTLASGVPMDILMPSGQARIPVLQRNAGGRVFDSAGELNAFVRDLNASGGIDGELLPLVSDERAVQRHASTRSTSDSPGRS